jgi:hypothetical protein
MLRDASVMRQLVPFALLGLLSLCLALVAGSALALAPEEQSGWRLQQRCAEFWSERPEEQPYQQCWREWVHPGIPTPGPNERP